MSNEPKEHIHRLIKRLFFSQLILISLTSLLVAIGLHIDLGFFWFSFLAGMFGASIALQRRIQEGRINFDPEISSSWYSTFMPLLYGGIMASVTYFLFISHILSGPSGEGLLTTNLFPDFNVVAPEEGRLTIRHWMMSHPLGLTNAGKLIIWSFIGGYSESFVTGVLSRLQQNTGREE